MANKVNTCDSVFNDSEPPEPGVVRKKEPLSTYDGIKEAIEVGFIMGIPMLSLRYWPKKFAFVFGGLSYIVLLGTFLYFLISGYEVQLSQKFISLTSTVGSCSQVVKPLSAQYYISNTSTEVYWQTASNFKFSAAKYLITFTNLEANFVDFYDLMTSFGDLLNNLGGVAVYRPMIFNLMVLMHLELNVDVPAKSNPDLNSMQSLVFAAEPATVYDRANVAAAIGSNNGYCMTSPRASFDNVKSEMVVQYFVSEFDAPIAYKDSAAAYNKTGDCVYCNSNVNVTCSDIVSKDALGYVERHGDLITVKNDIISLSTSVAVNEKVVSVTNFELFGEKTIIYKNLVMESKFDSNFERMTPLRCFSIDSSVADTTAVNDPTLEAIYLNVVDRDSVTCFSQFGEYLAASTVVHFVEECADCSTSSGNPDCNVFDILMSTIYFPNSTNVTYDGVKGVVDVLDMYYSFDNVTAFNAATYNAVRNIGFSLAVIDSTWFDFCGGSCVVMAVNVWDQGQNHRVSDKHLQMPYTHCNDIFSHDAFADLGEESSVPTPLVEVYYECTNNPFDAFLQSAGIAAGNTNAFGPILLLLVVLPAITIYFTLIQGDPPAEKYNLLLIEKAQREFIQKVLQANDGTLEGLPEDAVIRKVGRELYTLACFEEGKDGGAAKGDYKLANVKVSPEDAEL